MSSSAPQDMVHASVVAGGTADASTDYQRAGQGASVVLLSGDGTTSNALLAGLPRHFRLIAPNVLASLAVTASGFHAWLRGFLDALGVTRAAIVVGPCFAAQVLGFALTDPDRIGQLVFLVGACGNSFGEDAYHSLMICRARAGDRIAAIREYRRLESLFKRELESEPSLETATLFRRLQRGETI
jgi:pimeloyl-ACP methyl ester carboxylesterase